MRATAGTTTPPGRGSPTPWSKLGAATARTPAAGSLGGGAGGGGAGCAVGPREGWSSRPLHQRYPNAPLQHHARPTPSPSRPTPSHPPTFSHPRPPSHPPAPTRPRPSTHTPTPTCLPQLAHAGHIPLGVKGPGRPPPRVHRSWVWRSVQLGAVQVKAVHRYRRRRVGVPQRAPQARQHLCACVGGGGVGVGVWVRRGSGWSAGGRARPKQSSPHPHPPPSRVHTARATTHHHHLRRKGGLATAWRASNADEEAGGASGCGAVRWCAGSADGVRGWEGCQRGQRALGQRVVAFLHARAPRQPLLLLPPLLLRRRRRGRGGGRERRVPPARPRRCPPVTLPLLLLVLLVVPETRRERRSCAKSDRHVRRLGTGCARAPPVRTPSLHAMRAIAGQGPGSATALCIARCAPMCITSPCRPLDRFPSPPQ